MEGAGRDAIYSVGGGEPSLPSMTETLGGQWKFGPLESPSLSPAFSLKQAELKTDKAENDIVASGVRDRASPEIRSQTKGGPEEKTKADRCLQECAGTGKEVRPREKAAEEMEK